jgi:hypothetical protein
MAVLREGIAAAREGRGGIFLVSGPAGIGKSRLVGEAVADTASVVRGRHVARGRCSPLCGCPPPTADGRTGGPRTIRRPGSPGPGGRTYVRPSPKWPTMPWIRGTSACHGILEAAERDAFLVTWYARLEVPGIDLGSARLRALPTLVRTIESRLGSAHRHDRRSACRVARTRNRVPSGRRTTHGGSGSRQPVAGVQGAPYGGAGVRAVRQSEVTGARCRGAGQFLAIRWPTPPLIFRRVDGAWRSGRHCSTSTRPGGRSWNPSKNRRISSRVRK